MIHDLMGKVKDFKQTCIFSEKEFANQAAIADEWKQGFGFWFLLTGLWFLMHYLEWLRTTFKREQILLKKLFYVAMVLYSKLEIWVKP